MRVHDDWSDLAAERLDRIEQLIDEKAEIQAQFEAFKVAAEARDADVHEKLDAVRGHLRIATETIEKQRRELERFRPVQIRAFTGDTMLVRRLDDGNKSELVSIPLKLYAKDDHA